MQANEGSEKTATSGGLSAVVQVFFAIILAVFVLMFLGSLSIVSLILVVGIALVIIIRFREEWEKWFGEIMKESKRILTAPKRTEYSSTIIKEKEVVVKIRCPYCGNLYNELLDKCPHCGAKR